ncbi:MAG: hypothetical protein K0S37_3461 [Microbacterium sp.]|jgi:heat shock protein HslJ|nr:hypothetical protein [Microbacterium sp.]
MIRRFSLAAMAGLAAALTLTACGSPSSSESSPGISERIDGTWGDTSAHHLVLSDGTLKGSDGCNGMTGAYTTDGREIVVTLGPALARGCLNVDTWLSNIATATVSGDTLTVFNRAGELIGTLPRTA